MSMPTISPYIQDIDREQALNSVIGSIALSEAALSHILNADGEKLQLAVQLTDKESDLQLPMYQDDPEAALSDLLLVNDSVNDMVDRVSDLENILRSKFNSVLNFINPYTSPPTLVNVNLPIRDSNGNLVTGVTTLLTGMPDAVFTPNSSRQPRMPLFISQESTSDGSGYVHYQLKPGKYQLRVVKGGPNHTAMCHTYEIEVRGSTYTIDGKTLGNLPSSFNYIKTATADTTVAFTVSSDVPEAGGGGEESTRVVTNQPNIPISVTSLGSPEGEEWDICENGKTNATGATTFRLASGEAYKVLVNGTSEFTYDPDDPEDSYDVDPYTVDAVTTGPPAPPEEP
ncbi:hypothetical protein AGMMS49992_11450 [Clostridia bacterium]|nr:hypothetical protein AGMMS49992_11450 [Clostridia bacterium]